MTANTQEDTITSTPKGRSEWCSECYKESIKRFCEGYILTYNQRHLGTKEMPGLKTISPMVALAVYRWQDIILIQRKKGPDRASEHPQHAGAR